MGQAFGRSQTSDKAIVNIQILNCDAFNVSAIISAVKDCVLEQFFNIRQVHAPFTDSTFFGKENIRWIVKIIDDRNSVIFGMEGFSNLVQFIQDRALTQLRKDIGAPFSSFRGQLTISVIGAINGKRLGKYAELDMVVHSSSTQNNNTIT